MVPIFSERWIQELPMKRLGCKWVVCDNDPKARRLIHASVSALGKVWGCYSEWAGTHGASHPTLNEAKLAVESVVAKAIAVDLAQFDAVLNAGAGRTVISHITLQAIEAGMEDVIITALKDALAKRPSDGHHLILSGQRLPNGCVAGLSNGGTVIGIARPVVPAALRAKLRSIRGAVLPSDGVRVVFPFNEGQNYASLSDLLDRCQADAAQCVVEMSMPQFSRRAL